MHTQRTADEGVTPTEQTAAPAAWSVAVPQRSARRATARRASTRRATARRRKNDVEELIIEHLKHHPGSTTGAIAKALNADRDTIAAGLAHLVSAHEITDDHAVE